MFTMYTKALPDGTPEQVQFKEWSKFLEKIRAESFHKDPFHIKIDEILAAVEINDTKQLRLELHHQLGRMYCAKMNYILMNLPMDILVADGIVAEKDREHLTRNICEYRIDCAKRLTANRKNDRRERSK